MRKDYETYGISFDKDTFSVYSKEIKLFTLPISSAVDKYEDPRMRQAGSLPFESGIIEDCDKELSAPKIKEFHGKIVAEYTTGSNLWSEKCYTVVADKNGFSYGISVCGEGIVSRIRYFKSNFANTEYEFSGYMIPHAGQYKEIECMRNVFENSQLSFDYYAPCPFVYPFYTEGAEGWFGIGLFANRGEHNFDRFVYEKFFNFILPLDNRIKVSGLYTLPGIWGGYGKDAFAVMSAYSKWYFDSGTAIRHGDYENDPKWWKGPIFCGWGEQQKLSRELGRPAAEFATQENYEKWVDTLLKKGLKPRIVIIDAKWQKGMGNTEVDTEKWYDLRGFADKLHGMGIKVLLWIKSWDSEGLPKNECIDNLCNPVSQDPTNPMFIERTKRNIYKLLSSDAECYNCDGFKIDFINCTPKGEMLRVFDGKSYGAELIRKWLELVYTSAKSVKSDALINASCAHPYTADVCDQIRLHDYQGALRSSVEVMTFRAKIAKAIYGNVTCDTDSGGTVSHRDFLRYIEAQPQIGVPDLYYVTESFGTPMDEGDYDAIRTAWNKYINDNEL